MAVAAHALPLPDPPLEGEGFVLRAWSVGDAGALAAAWVDPEVVRWTAVPAEHDEAAARRWIGGEARRRQRGLALDLVIDVAGTVAGEVGLAAFDPSHRTAEVGWWVAAPHRGRGLATEAVRAVASWATTELDLDGLVARCQAANAPALGVARSAGFAEVPAAAAGTPATGEVVWCFPGQDGGTVPT